jgi:hypothetical protein
VNCIRHPVDLKTLNRIENIMLDVAQLINLITYYYKNNKMHYIHIIVEGYFTIRRRSGCTFIKIRHHDVIPPKSYCRKY